MAIYRTAEGFLFRDDFDRPDDTDIGNDWVELDTTDWVIDSNELRVTAASGSQNIENQANLLGPGFAQVRFWPVGQGNASLHLRFAWNGGDVSSYLIAYNTTLGDLLLQRGNGNGTFTTLQGGASGGTAGAVQRLQLHVQDGLQRGFLYNGNNWNISRSATDTTLDSVDGRVAIRRSFGALTTARYDDLILCTSPYITVTGLLPGQKARVFGAGDTLIAEAHESGGVAIIDCAGVGGSDGVPQAGWAALVVSLAGNAEIERWDAGGVYPGDAFEFVPDQVPVRMTLGGTEFVTTTPAVAVPVRMTLGGVEFVSFLLSPAQPVVEALGVPGSIQVQGSPYVAPEDAGPHIETHVEIAEESDPSFASPVIQDVIDLDPLTIRVYTQDDGLQGDEGYWVRIRYLGENGGPSLWSEPVLVQTEPLGPRPGTPTITLLDVAPDYIRDQGSIFAHEEGTTTAELYDPMDNPFPFLQEVHWQIRLQATSDLLEDTGPIPPDANPPERIWVDLVDGVTFERRVRYFDGHYQTWSLWSDWVAVATPEEPVIRPDKPVITIPLCGGDEIQVQGSTYSHPASDPHAATQWRIRWAVSGSGTTQTIESPSTVFAWPAGLGGSWLLDVRYRDATGRWSEWSDPEPCEIQDELPQPIILTPVSGHVTETDPVTVTWEMPEGFTDSVEYELDLSPDDGTNWLPQELDNPTIGEWVFDPTDRPNGAYMFRIRACHLSGGRCGLWAFVAIVVDHTGVVSIHYDFTQYQQIDPSWVQIWDEADRVTWRLVDKELVTVGPDHPRPTEGILAGATQRLSSGSANPSVESILAFTELGQPRSLETIIILAVAGNECHWFGQRWSSVNALKGGSAWAADGIRSAGTRKGMRIGADCGIGVIGCPPYGIECTGGCGTCTPCRTCPPNMIGGGGCCRNPCACATCAQCHDCGPALMGMDVRFPGHLHRYATARYHAMVRGRTYREGQSFSASSTSNSVQQTDQRIRGMGVSYRRNRAAGCSPECTWIHTYYTLRTVYSRLPSGGTRIQSRLFGPGLDQPQWTMDWTISAALTEDLGCGFCGLSFSDYPVQLDGPHHGILFRSMTVISPDGFVTGGPLLGTPTVED